MCPSRSKEEHEASTDSRATTTESLDLASAPQPALRRPADRLSRSLGPARSSSSPSRSRRSVVSMKSLMPLALSPSCSSVWSASSAEDPVAERVDDYFPEVLARDLELSARIFASKRMTAGSTISTLSAEERERHRASRMTPSLPYLAASARVRSLGPIEERSSRVSFLNPQGGAARVDDNASDIDSRSTAQASDYTGPPSIRPRESVMTMATSLASTNWKTSLKSPTPSDGLLGSSWIDGDSDDGAHHAKLEAMAPRPPTPPESDRASGVPAVKVDVRGHWGYDETPLHRKSHSVSGGSPVGGSRRKLSAGSLDVPLRPVSTAGVGGRESRGPREPPPPPFVARRLFSPCEEQARPRCPRSSTGASHKARKNALHINLLAEPSPVSEEFPDLEDDGASMPASQTYPPPGSSSMDAPPHLPRPALRSVQSWLNGSPQPYPRSLQGDDRAKVVPLPPDTMETLRVSIACFPETMLLSSSLTVETIRAYSRKVRQPSIELLRTMPVRSPSPESPNQAGRKSLWRKVVPYRKGCDAPEPKARGHHSGANSVDSTTSGSLSPKPWEPLKHIFGGCSEYI